jgi:phage shock protein PspC (stress-responsive transcriptional regulator)
VLAAAHDMCTRFLDNKMALKGRGGKAREDGVVQGVLALGDYYQGTDISTLYILYTVHMLCYYTTQELIYILRHSMLCT